MSLVKLCPVCGAEYVTDEVHQARRDNWAAKEYLALPEAFPYDLTHRGCTGEKEN